MKKPILPLVLILGASLGAASCGNNVQGNDASPVFLETNIGGNGSLLVLFKLVNDNAPLQISSIIVTNHPKNPGATTSTFMDVVLEDYVVSWTRIDSGKTASAPQRFTATGIAPVNGQNNLQNFPVMSADALQQPPLNQLFPFNGGIDRETNTNEIRQAFTIVFHGHTMAGQAVTSVPAVSNTIIFIYQAPAGIVGVRMEK